MMIWECSECGEQFTRPRAPVVCGECGTAGTTFVRADQTDPVYEPDNLAVAWLRAGMDRAVASRREQRP